MTEQKKRICIVGGGFGGLYTALRLSEYSWEDSQTPEIILIDRHDRFLFSPLLYELVTGEMQTWEIAPPFAELLVETGIQFCQATVTDIDIETRQVKLDNHPDLSYDYLVIATGGTTPIDLVVGAKDYAIPFRTLQDAYRLRERLRQLEHSDGDKIRVAIVGGGYSGVELACKLADRLGERGKLRLIERGDTILKTSPEFNRNAAKAVLEEKRVWLDLETEVEEIEADTISLRYKGQVDTIPVDIVLWTVGNQVSDFIQSLPLKQSSQGLLATTPTLQVEDHPEIFALGDVADCTDAIGQKIPATAQSAFQQSDCCALNIGASLTGKPLSQFRYQALGEMMALGVDKATMSGLGMKLDGNFAYVARRLIYLYRLPTWQHQLTVGLNWATQPLAELLGALSK